MRGIANGVSTPSPYPVSEYSIRDVIDELHRRLLSDDRLQDLGHRCAYEHVGVMSLVLSDVVHDLMPDPWGRRRG
jgi:hypothetical protein